MVDDDVRLTAVVVRALQEAGHVADVAPTGPSGLLAAQLGDYDVIILDWMLPGMTGLDVCRELRRRTVLTPILVLTARAGVVDRVEGLDVGADDYVTKPFSLDELLARLRALARRAGAHALPVVRVGDLTIDADRRRVTRGATEIEVTAREFDVLLLLAQRAGRVVTREYMLHELWDGESDLRSNVIDVNISALRAKVDKPFGLETIETLRGTGYRLNAAEG
jgi:two-component system OmpR family response regulator